MGDVVGDVVVVGGGIGGATTALLLARAGTRVTVLERTAAPAAVGAGILLQANGLAVLHALGLRQRLEARSGRLDGVALLRPDGTAIAGQAVPDLGHGLDHLLVLRRSHLAAVLDETMAAAERIEVVRGADVESVSPGGEVHFHLTDGCPGTRSLQGDLVVGADGVRSTVRRGGRFGARVRSGSSTYLRGLVDGSADLTGEAWTSLGLFGAAGVGDGTYFYADATHPSVAEALHHGDLHQLRARWRSAVPAAGSILDRVDDIGQLLVNGVARVDCAGWVDRRLVLLGDAAHAMEPTAGQGANSALVDAAVLARELDHHTLLADALSAYDAQRRPAVKAVQDLADRLARLSRVRPAALRAARDRILHLVDRPASAERRYRQLQQIDPADLYLSLRRRFGPS